MKPGDLIEFWSASEGGRWLPGVVDRVMDVLNRRTFKPVRIRTGPGVWVIRPLAKCREARKT